MIYIEKIKQTQENENHNTSQSDFLMIYTRKKKIAILIGGDIML
jgi:hypothetical protein